jgi:hypothetical protein
MRKGPVSIALILLSALALSACEKKAEAPAAAPAAEQAAPAAAPAMPAEEPMGPATDEEMAAPEADDGENTDDEAQGGGPRV